MSVKSELHVSSELTMVTVTTHNWSRIHGQYLQSVVLCHESNHSELHLTRLPRRIAAEAHPHVDRTFETPSQPDILIIHSRYRDSFCHCYNIVTTNWVQAYLIEYDNRLTDCSKQIHSSHKLSVFVCNTTQIQYNK